MVSSRSWSRACCPVTARRTAFSLVELLVVIAIIGLLMGLLVPAVQAGRESARRSACTNNVRQLVLAVHGYESARRAFPPSMQHALKTIFISNNGSWSIHGRILPFIEEGTAAARVDLEQAWDDGFTAGTPDPASNWAIVRDMRVKTFICPSERNTMMRTKASGGVNVPFVAPHTYGFNFGTWFVYDPDTGAGGDGSFHPNSRFTSAMFTDGLCKTLCVAEVKAFTPYVRNTSDPGDKHPAGSPPGGPAAISGLCAGGDAKLGVTTNDCTGHTEWPDGRVHHAGFTTVFAPNTRVPHVASGIEHDVDYNSRQEGTHATQKTYAAITSRSHHAGGVVTAMMDGSVGFMSESIELSVWRALGTRSRGETTALP